ncbi:MULTISPECIES: rhodanese-like domain-containing protein [Enterovibrio]|uniref:rhodanese-like domain-containing protein n=1 Tax=Enterovibrio TaxID=188143 RepID=UPI001FE0B261|nr:MULTISPECIES: rhodanese-like domain-containing protein [Enterovibrio]
MFVKTKQIVIGLVAMLLSGVVHAEAVWIDTRSAAEHFFDHIPGDIRFSHTDIVNEVTALYPDKNQEIRLYCLSGVRSGKAMKALKAEGYQNVFNAGGIEDARAQRGLLDE